VERKSGATKFIDEAFPPCLRSLVGDQLGKKQMSPEVLEVEWVRASQWGHDTHLFGTGDDRHTAPSCARLGDPFQVACLPADGREMVISEDLANGTITIEVLWHGKSHNITIDDFVPVIDGQLAYCTTTPGGGLWPVLYMKALAKAAGSYATFAQMRRDGGCTDKDVAQVLVSCIGTLPADDSYYLSTVKEFFTPAICAEVDKGLPMDPDILGVLPEGLHPVPSTHTYGPTPIGHCKGTWTIHAPAISLRNNATKEAGVAVNVKLLGAGGSDEKKKTSWYQAPIQAAKAVSYIAIIAEETSEGLEIIDSISWDSEFQADFEGQLGVMMGIHSHCIAFVASSGMLSSCEPVAFKVNSTVPEGDLVVSTEVIHGEDGHLMLEEGAHVVGVQCPGLVAVPEPEPDTINKAELTEAQQSVVDELKPKLLRAKNELAESQEEGDVELSSAMSGLEPEDLLDLIVQVAVPIVEIDVETGQPATLVIEKERKKLLSVESDGEDIEDRKEGLRAQNSGFGLGVTSSAPMSAMGDLPKKKLPDSPEHSAERGLRFSRMKSSLKHVGPDYNDEHPITKPVLAHHKLSGTHDVGSFGWQMDSATSRRAFEAMDEDADGQISVDEVIRYLITLKPEDRPLCLRQVNPWSKSGHTKIIDTLAAMDNNHDGYISYEELYGIERGV